MLKAMHQYTQSTHKKRINELIIIRHFANEHELDLENLLVSGTNSFFFLLCSVLGIHCTNYSIRRSFLVTEQPLSISDRTIMKLCEQTICLCAQTQVHSFRVVSVREIFVYKSLLHSFFVVVVAVVTLFKHDQKVVFRTSRCDVIALSLNQHTKWVDICILVCFIGSICILW